MEPIKAIDLATLLKDVPRGAWVALSSEGDRVLAFGFDLQGAMSEAAEQGEPAPIITRVPESSTALFL